MSVRRSAAMALAVAVLLVGCQDEPEPGTDPTPSASPSESETTQEPEAQTAEEFIEEWFELNTEMQNTGETEAFLAVARRCKPCQTLARRVAEIYEAGGSVTLRRQHVEAIERVSSAATLEQFDVTVHASPTLVTEREGAEVHRLPGGSNVYRVTLLQEGEDWFMQNLLDVS